MKPFHRIFVLATALTALVAMSAAAPPAAAQPDLVINNVQVLDCGRIQVTMRNQGNQLNNTITAASVVVYPAGTPNLNVWRKNVFFSAIGAGQSRTMTVSGPSPNPPNGTGKQRAFTNDGAHTIQVVADGTEVVNETNENNNIFNTNHNANGCSLAEPCELAAVFSWPTYSNLPASNPAKLTAKFTNSGGESCPAKTLVLRRYSGSSPSGPAVTVGSSQLPTVAASRTKKVSWVDSNHPTSGTFTYAFTYQGGFSDGNNGNHSPSKTVTFTSPVRPGGGGGSGAGCDLSAQFTAPNGSNLPGGGTISWNVLFKNQGSGQCKAAKVRLNRFKGNTCSGYGSLIGGSGNIQMVQELAPGQSQTVVFTERRAPRSGRHCYQLKYSSPFNDSNNSNHRPQRKVNFQ
ncbi:MAG: CARDB domain-containing protein [Acidobacteriota bacterium]